MNKMHPTNRRARGFAALALAVIAVLTLSLGLALRPATVEAKSAPGTVVRKDKETETPKPTKTADPSKTPEPTETETVEPTETVELTETPEPTETVEPTETPELTETPEPTETVEPTETPEGTRTPAPVAQRTRFELKGALESKGGTWRISGQDVIVDGSTRIDESDGAAVVGAQVEVKGFRDSANRLLATRIKVESGNGGGGGGGNTSTLTKWRGFVEKLPATGLLGEWQVGGRTFTVNNQTQLPDGAAAYKVGAWVKVQAMQASNGAVTAHEVELEND